mmetsp:Transcript_61043/g.119719  ORF Transcript_61043/g.119719 Transcript_61043/m.119719 type:complete len:85 (+) Transcript_61043:574-828(+)
MKLAYFYFARTPVGSFSVTEITHARLFLSCIYTRHQPTKQKRTGNRKKRKGEKNREKEREERTTERENKRKQRKPEGECALVCC